ncbi:FKBP-type peptidyl-prolyl cis-trans isomerase [Flavobacterium johnsoniae]|uniref:FKBP-type peptidyl-prolyl cis-trans isomerase n=1 Tax=Flavobacterium johnsoniae TaxID=986 RepID=UPI0025B13A87|nr:FKBP-type peptidyl-prolyl cis-trans isomerase [Flavobacterium johnsoniae]WJS94806.1 FKBP-type peptidyl-prolyl cis-trans isomerase [Flavobacterium johnsoniae]
MKKLLIALLTLTLYVSCSSPNSDVVIPPPKDYTAENEKEITDYLAKNNLTAQKTESGLHYIITEEGTGKRPTLQSNISVTYKGSLLTNGKVFDERTTATTFPLNRLILGWQQGLPFFKEGGSGILFVPAHLGYGSYTVSTIPGGSVLIFEIKLISTN